VPEKYVQVDGIATFVRHVGPTTLPEAPPDLARGEAVVCLHCAEGNSAIFTDLLERVGAAHSPLAFDRPGHARSGQLDALASVARMSQFTLALCDKLGIERGVWLGTSLGGAIALETALAAPQRTRALVIIGSGARISVPDPQLEQVRRITEGKGRREFGRTAYSPAASPDVMRRGFMEDLKTDPRAVYENLRAARDFDRERDLERVKCPTLVVVGEDDAVPGGQAQAEQLAARIPGARKVVIQKCGHRATLEQPEALANAVLGFLAELPR
jgi:pimeloyl-ACP methyl ester carboxylesterase